MRTEVRIEQDLRIDLVQSVIVMNYAFPSNILIHLICWFLEKAELRKSSYIIALWHRFIESVH